MTNRLSPQHDSARRGDWLQNRRLQDVQTTLGELLADCQLTTEEILELACIDILARVRPGYAVDLSSYFADFPELAENPECVLDLIDAEICARREQRLPIDTAEYCTRFPQLADNIARLIEIDALETCLDDGTDFSFDENATAAKQGVLPAVEPTSNVASSSEFIRFCSVELPSDVRITGLLALREEVTCLRGVSVGNQAVVIKVVSKRRLPDEDLPLRIGDYLERLATVSHPAWIAPDVIAENASQFAMVRPWVAGTLMTNRFLRNGFDATNGRPSTPQIGLSKILKELADLGYAIAAVHSIGLAHGSLHPHNLFRDHDGALRIVDAGFGFPDPATQWEWRLPAAPEPGSGSDAHRVDVSGQRRDVASFARIVDRALSPYSDACQDQLDTPLRRLVQWCQTGAKAMSRQFEATELADDLLRLADGRPLKLPRGRSPWLPKSLSQLFGSRN